MLVNTFNHPYYAVIFSSIINELDNEYAETAERMLQLASQQKGFLGAESAREALGITVSYWRDEQSIREWKLQSEHLIAQKKGRESWYKKYRVRIAKVERNYGV